MTSDSELYHPEDAIQAAVNGTLVTGTFGFVVSGIQNTLAKTNVGMRGVFTRSGRTIGIFGAIGGTYEFAKMASANLRETKDSYNSAIGGLFAGSILGLARGSGPAVVGMGFMTAVVLGAFDYTGSSLTGYTKDLENEFDRKDALRKNVRRPIEETISEMGEGRGVYAPGYAERRREKIKETYGIDVGTA